MKLENFTIENQNVLIVGCGISGIGAALNFLNNNYEDFIIIEALDRIGGRCHTIQHNDSYLEMGAQWIHGQIDNPIFEYAAANKLLDDGHDIIDLSEDDNDKNITALTGLIKKDDNDLKGMGFYTENGAKVPQELIIDASNTLDFIVKNAERYENKRLNDCSFKEYINENFNKLIINNDKYKNENDSIKSILKGICSWRCKYECGDNGCSTLDTLSVKYFSTYVELKGNQLVELKYGYKAIIDSMIKKVDHEKFYSKLRLKHSLNFILICKNLLNNKNENKNECEHCLYTLDKNKVVVSITNNNENKNLIFICNHVICTMSLGYLKVNFNKIFPNYENYDLFKEKILSINKLGFGVVNKIYLEYEKPFWNEDSLGYQLIWLDKIDYDDKEIEKEWYKNIIGFECVKNHDNILCAWIYGCENYENLNDEIVKHDCTNVLKKFLDCDYIPMPIKIIRSNWFSNSNFFGSYSHIALNSTDNDIKVIAQPIPLNELPLVNFAGEATNEKFYSTVHGAYESGIRESKRILSFLSRLK